VSLTLRVGPLSCWCPVRGEAATESLGDTGTTDGGSSDEDERDALSVLVPAIINGGPTGSSSENCPSSKRFCQTERGGRGKQGCGSVDGEGGAERCRCRSLGRTTSTGGSLISVFSEEVLANTLSEAAAAAPCSVAAASRF
jgi:hypothetical protein